MACSYEKSVHPSWVEPLAPVADHIARAGQFLREEIAAGRPYQPAGENVLRAFQQPFEDVRVLIVGQDPYPTEGHPIGLSFAVEKHVRPLPGSLKNIYTELRNDLGIEPPEHGDLSAWTDQGVMLLNRVLTVRPGAPGSHRGQGWENVTAQAITALAERKQPLVAILWGKDARTLRKHLGDTHTVESAHPSPLAAYRGFFGSKPFSRTNELLEQLGTHTIDWRIA